MLGPTGWLDAPIAIIIVAVTGFYLGVLTALKSCFPTLKCMANKQDGKQSQALFYFYEAGNV